jgi:starch phosphorylase
MLTPLEAPLTALGLRVSGASNGVSMRHGIVARSMWQPLFPDHSVEQTPIGHVTNGVHVPTWTAEPMRDLLLRYLGPGFDERAADPEVWAAVESIPDEELWSVRRQLRARLVTYARDRATSDRLGRGEPIEYAEAATRALSDETLTIGFARRATAYKRLYLLSYDPERALRLLDNPHPIQVLLAGKPHPADDEGKRLVQGLFGLRWAPHVAERVAYLEDYHMGMAAQLVAGCDVWVNTPRPPLEACGTSGMKAALNGALNLSVIDGWWEEAYDGTNGWAIISPPDADATAQDVHDATALYELLEREVIPLFYDRDEHGIPRGWVARVKASLRTIGPRFCAGRMLDDYVRDVYVSAGVRAR